MYKYMYKCTCKMYRVHVHVHVCMCEPFHTEGVECGDVVLLSGSTDIMCSLCQGFLL